ncbi:hypothetical protein GCM10010970_08290 [Silvimonas iriomotensis]|uniref:Uncharacterized protein n=1 Tax=Silvimonas iriomotensis TaxID=449662 RepID=A0ABQ2P6B9_9NEIS|nr:hypothetical protein GCM10010970_08290 [Silvimonas iriomotensis]
MHGWRPWNTKARAHKAATPEQDKQGGGDTGKTVRRHGAGRSKKARALIVPTDAPARRTASRVATKKKHHKQKAPANRGFSLA